MLAVQLLCRANSAAVPRSTRPCHPARGEPGRRTNYHHTAELQQWLLLGCVRRGHLKIGARSAATMPLGPPAPVHRLSGPTCAHAILRRRSAAMQSSSQDACGARVPGWRFREADLPPSSRVPGLALFHQRLLPLQALLLVVPGLLVSWSSRDQERGKPQATRNEGMGGPCGAAWRQASREQGPTRSWRRVSGS